ncbi:hypothetical protein ACU4GD_29635 [Cupriavidus basilensis]
MTKTIGLLLAVSPFALALVTGLVELPRKGGSLLPLLSLYGIAFVPGAALTLFLQLQVSRPLRRLASCAGRSGRDQFAAGAGARAKRRCAGGSHCGSRTSLQRQPPRYRRRRLFHRRSATRGHQ